MSRRSARVPVWRGAGGARSRGRNLTILLAFGEIVVGSGQLSARGAGVSRSIISSTACREADGYYLAHYRHDRRPARGTSPESVRQSGHGSAHGPRDPPPTRFVARLARRGSRTVSRRARTVRTQVVRRPDRRILRLSSWLGGRRIRRHPGRCSDLARYRARRCPGRSAGGRNRTSRSSPWMPRSASSARARPAVSSRSSWPAAGSASSCSSPARATISRAAPSTCAATSGARTRGRPAPGTGSPDASGGATAYRLEGRRARGIGGSTLHWEGYALRLHANDFRLRSLYGIA